MELKAGKCLGETEDAEECSGGSVGVGFFGVFLFFGDFAEADIGVYDVVGYGGRDCGSFLACFRDVVSVRTQERVHFSQSISLEWNETYRMRTGSIGSCSS